MPLIFCVFATKRGVITKYAKYEEVGCQENSHKSASEIACEMRYLNTLFDFSPQLHHEMTSLAELHSGRY